MTWHSGWRPIVQEYSEIKIEILEEIQAEEMIEILTVLQEDFQEEALVQEISEEEVDKKLNKK